MDYRLLGNYGPQWDAMKSKGYSGQDAENKLMQMGDQFSGMFKNAVGRDPTPEEMGAMYQNIGGEILGSPAGYGGTSTSDLQNLMNPYLQNTYGADISANQQNQQTSQLNKSQGLVQDLINKTMNNTSAQFADPNSQLYQQFSGGMNNQGISPSSGAFQAGAGSTIANSGMNAMNTGLESVGLPQISNMANTANAPYEQSLQNMYPGLSSYGQNQSSLYNFGLQSDLAKQLAAMMQPSGAQSAMGMASGAAGGAGSIMQGLGAMKSGGCFLSTACLSAMGLPDDCDDLSILRQFRDKYVKMIPRGLADIREYYRIAPGIVKEIDGRDDKMDLYRGIYRSIVKPCVRLISAGFWDRAFRLYKSQTDRLYRLHR